MVIMVITVLNFKATVQLKF